MPKVIFINRDGSRIEVEAAVGSSLLDVAHRHSIDIEGACEGSMACATCHLIVDPKDFDRLEAVSEDEEDMLDLAFGVTRTSRLGCQVIVTEALDGLTVSLPKEIRNLMG
ncbi:MAG: 2Fe-2S iron-sulfur cluster binding domain-containing protein [Alphaproteobacteria bacterium]|nr:2Fe-2S iron-sulfur cluster binding domain-containing protein [Alphaproteobacteria bacterium]